MKSVVILITLASWSTAQIIYPDEFETMTATARPQQFQSDVPSFNKAFVRGRPNGYNGFSAPPAAFSPAFSQNSQVRFGLRTRMFNEDANFSHHILFLFPRVLATLSGF